MYASFSPYIDVRSALAPKKLGAALYMMSKSKARQTVITYVYSYAKSDGHQAKRINK